MKKITKKHLFIIIPSGVLLLIIIAFIVLLITNKYTLTIDCAETSFLAEYGEEFDVPAMTAQYKGTTLPFWNKKVDVTYSAPVNTSILGEQKIDVSASHKKKKATISLTINVVDKEAPRIELVSNPDYYTKPNHKYQEEGYKAIDNCDGDITKLVKAVEKDGEVTYTVSDKSGNTTTVTRKIIYKDTVAPIITLQGDKEMTINYGSEFADPGFSAKDDCDGDITDKVTVKGTVDTGILGTYTLTYTVFDSYNNTTELSRIVYVSDCEKPNISLNGDSTIYIKLGTSYVDKGATAIDNLDGDITDKITVNSSVNTNKKGIYNVEYSVTDNAGNTAYSSRKVYVYEKQAENNAKNPGKKVVYLTFDDGPSAYTGELLDILKKYNVKATFFVTGQGANYRNNIKRAYKEGHTIALHTYNHDYSKIYSSVDNYFEDLEKISDVVYDLIGIRPNILRFPGGSSNHSSFSYCSGIMSSLVKDVGVMGYLYCDWNVTSGDASNYPSRDSILNNIINGIKNNDVSIVLQHDTVSQSVDAVEEAIVWGLAHGYTFLPMDETTPMIHHSVAN